jgi:hypothetical protein
MAAAMERATGRAPGLAPRLRRLPRRTVLGHEVAVAGTHLSRLLGLALLTRAGAGGGLLLPGCRSVHTFGMRFPLDLVFLDAEGAEIELRRAVRPGRFAAERDAWAVLELPTGAGVGSR